MPSKRDFATNKILIGITGGIGSGKSLAAHYFEKLGIKVINADSFTKELYRSDAKLKAKLVAEFGKGILDKNGYITGPEARRIIFSNAESIKRVNKIVHPFVIKGIDSLIEKIKRKVILIESAIVFESGFYRKLDYVIMIYSPKDLRIQRVAMRDGAKMEDVEKLMKLQMPEDEKLKRADFVLKNEGKKVDLKRAVKNFSKVLEAL